MNMKSMQIKIGVREWYQNQWRHFSSSPNQWWSFPPSSLESDASKLFSL